MKLWLRIADESELTVESNIDLILRSNNTNLLYLNFINEDDTAIDITSAKIYFTVKEQLSDEDDDSLLKIDDADFIAPMSGEAKIEITSEDVAEITGNHLYSIKIKLVDNKIYTVAEGIITFKQELSSRED